eukprot:c20903_g1_i1.p1 GENE.c20903_g1_i1~~c20903_g1_i1.p1  ORF type:complete len:938 (+),score=93.91 c20903_g1_i1:111-2816(+)
MGVFSKFSETVSRVKRSVLQYRGIVLVHDQARKQFGNTTVHMTRCNHAEVEAIQRLRSRPDCEELLLEIASAQPDFESLCEQSCWPKFSAEIHRLNNISCTQEIDAQSLDDICESIVPCDTRVAVGCIDNWVEEGCPVEPLPSECQEFAYCAVETELGNRCPSPTPSPTPSTSGIPGYLPPPPAPGCCVTFGYGSRMIPCCHIFEDDVSSENCGVSEGHLGGNRDHHPGKSCLQVRELYTKSPSPSQSPSSFPSHSPSNSPTPSMTPGPDCKRLSNCSSHGHCVVGECVCDKGYGRVSSSELQDCSEFTLGFCPSLCFGNGNCKAGKSCQCFGGFVGDLCNVWEGCKSFNYCSGHGSCTDGETCSCDPGFSGEDCSIHHNSIQCPDNCSGNGVCRVAWNGARVCECIPTFEGDACEIYVGPVCPNNCSGLGHCSILGTCECNPGTHGADCSELRSECRCGNGICVSGQCQCQRPYSGAQCEVYDPTLDTACAELHFCSGRGLCHETHRGFICACFVGFSGKSCQFLDVDDPEICPKYCSGHGKCVLSSDPHCFCETGWVGADCGTPECPITDGAVCSGHGICEHGSCTCDFGWRSGALGSCDESLCLNDCSGHGLCLFNGMCACQNSWSGDDCSVDDTHFLGQSSLTGDTSGGDLGAGATTKGSGEVGDETTASQATTGEQTSGIDQVGAGGSSGTTSDQTTSQASSSSTKTQGTTGAGSGVGSVTDSGLGGSQSGSGSSAAATSKTTTAARTLVSAAAKVPNPIDGVVISGASVGESFFTGSSYSASAIGTTAESTLSIRGTSTGGSLDGSGSSAASKSTSSDTQSSSDSTGSTAAGASLGSKVPTSGASENAKTHSSQPSCPNSCNGHGECNFGFCDCYDGYRGIDCSTAPQPVVTVLR